MAPPDSGGLDTGVYQSLYARWEALTGFRNLLGLELGESRAVAMQRLYRNVLPLLILANGLFVPTSHLSGLTNGLYAPTSRLLSRTNDLYRLTFHLLNRTHGLCISTSPMYGAAAQLCGSRLWYGRSATPIVGRISGLFALVLEAYVKKNRRFN